eukprot:TRINITY_DN2959_c0_g1_i1.p1 TRINITY_DN2959_c0_g1~~TRINITY_DN2959_c0_g1_i1.p1  ORF type:complete len:248 (+),score=54.03 TRINITY_DN2959_c0_g1_i1:78-821(+)
MLRSVLSSLLPRANSLSSLSSSLSSLLRPQTHARLFATQLALPSTDAAASNERVVSVTKSNKWKISPRKLNDLAIDLRRLGVDEALRQMQLSRKRIAHDIYKLILNARANAVQNHNMDPARLLIDEAWVGKDVFLKRIRIAAKGRFGVMHHPYCKMYLKLVEAPVAAAGERVGYAGRKAALVYPEELSEQQRAAQPTNDMTHRLRMRTTPKEFLHHWAKPADDHRAKIVFKNKPRDLGRSDSASASA